MYKRQLGAWANKIREQPLQLDSITVLGQSDAVPAAQAGFVSQLKHRFNRFIASFVMDYGTLSSAEGNVSLRVWVFSGRDQAQLLKSLIDNDFTPKHGIGVSVELVSGGIIEAMPVSYTHLDVYKRQVSASSSSKARIMQ